MRQHCRARQTICRCWCWGWLSSATTAAMLTALSLTDGARCGTRPSPKPAAVTTSKAHWPTSMARWRFDGITRQQLLGGRDREHRGSSGCVMVRAEWRGPGSRRRRQRLVVVADANGTRRGRWTSPQGGGSGSRARAPQRRRHRAVQGAITRWSAITTATCIG